MNNNNIISNDYNNRLYWVFGKNALSITIEEKKYNYSKEKKYNYSKVHKVYTPELKPIKNIIKRNKIVKFNL